jgi:hypothetical protein
MDMIPALRMGRQEDVKFKGSLGYIARPCIKKKNLNPSLMEISSIRLQKNKIKSSVVYLKVCQKGEKINRTQRAR